MKLLLGSFFVFATVSAVFGADCQWTPCAGKFIPGQEICNTYNLGIYNSQVYHSDCKWDSDKVQCCKPTEGGECKWTNTCYGMNYGGRYVCSKEFGSDFIPSGETSAEGCGAFTKSHQCCN